MFNQHKIKDKPLEKVDDDCSTLKRTQTENETQMEEVVVIG
jgi:hypothetical protein